MGVKSHPTTKKKPLELWRGLISNVKEKEFDEVGTP
jgi:hypothetical protein